MASEKYVVITEFGYIGSKEEHLPEKSKYTNAVVNDKTFYALCEFAKTDKGSEVLKLKKYYGNDVLQAKNYVGVIQTKDGTVVEILPKIYRVDENCSDDDAAIKKTREILTKMLRRIKTLPGFKNLDFADLHVSKLPLYEIFISMFIQEVNLLITRGVKSRYLEKTDNEFFLKGKLALKEHISKNVVTRQKFFVTYDDFLPNIPENRLIKTATKVLMKSSHSEKNITELRKIISIFENVEFCRDILKDFSQCKNDRTMSYYARVLRWCGLFLNHKSFTTQKGADIAFALFFPMEKIFEKYILWYVNNKLGMEEISKKRKLFAESKNIEFNIEPDMAGCDSREYYIIDAKWKLLDEKDVEKKGGISQADLYQLYAYQAIFKKEAKNKTMNLFLVYPQSEEFQGNKTFVYQDDNNTQITVCAFDLASEVNSLKLEHRSPDFNVND